MQALVSRLRAIFAGGDQSALRSIALYRDRFINGDMKLLMQRASNRRVTYRGLNEIDRALLTCSTRSYRASVRLLSRERIIN